MVSQRARRRFLGSLAALATMALGCVHAPPTAAFDQQVARGDTVLLMLYGRTCPHCAAAWPSVDALQEDLASSLSVVRVEYTTPEGDALMTRYRVDSVPTYLMFVQGELVYRQVGGEPNRRAIRRALPLL